MCVFPVSCFPRELVSVGLNMEDRELEKSDNLIRNRCDINSLLNCHSGYMQSY